MSEKDDRLTEGSMVDEIASAAEAWQQKVFGPPSEPDADDITKALAEQCRRTPNLPLLYAVIQLIDLGSTPTRVLLDGFRVACDLINSAYDNAARALSLAQMPPIHITLDGPAKVWFIAAPYYEPDFNGYLWAGEEALNYSTLRLFASEKKALEEAAKEGRACLRADLENDTLWKFCTKDLVSRLSEQEAGRLDEVIHAEVPEGDDEPSLFRAPFRTLTDAECDEVLELLPHLKWIVSTSDFNRGDS